MWSSCLWGMWRNDRLSGNGMEWTYVGTARYVGTFRGGLKHGSGVMRHRGCCIPLGMNPILVYLNRHLSRRLGPCATKIHGEWDDGRLSGRAMVITPCGISVVAMYQWDSLRSIIGMVLPPRPARAGRPALGGIVIEGIRWRIRATSASIGAKTFYLSCEIVVPWERRALDAYVAYIEGGGMCYARSMVDAVIDLANDTRRLLNGRCKPPADGYHDFVA